MRSPHLSRILAPLRRVPFTVNTLVITLFAVSPVLASYIMVRKTTPSDRKNTDKTLPHLAAKDASDLRTKPSPAYPSFPIPKDNKNTVESPYLQQLQQHITGQYGRLPLAFEENTGQTSSQVAFSYQRRRGRVCVVQAASQ